MLSISQCALLNITHVAVTGMNADATVINYMVNIDRDLFVCTDPDPLQQDLSRLRKGCLIM